MIRKFDIQVIRLIRHDRAVQTKKRGGEEELRDQKSAEFLPHMHDLFCMPMYVLPSNVNIHVNAIANMKTTHHLMCVDITKVTKLVAEVGVNESIQ